MTPVMQEAMVEQEAHDNEMNKRANNRRLVVVSNREPYKVQLEEGEVQVEKTPGGLVTALDPVLKESKGVWVCWEGTPQRVENFHDQPAVPTLSALAEQNHEALPYEIRTVALSENEINHYYYGFANTRLWPLFHYFPDKCDFLDERDWPSYESANQKFADKVVEATNDDDLVWVQDYQLFLVPHMIREQAPSRKIAFFCHIPFPDFEVYRILPKREDILRGMLGADMIGFHIPSYAKHFLECVKNLMHQDVHIDWSTNVITYQNRKIKVGAFPISIDYDRINDLSQTPAIQTAGRELRKSFQTEFIGVGLDRLDYSKGILERLESIDRFFERYPDYIGRLSFVQIASPTRTQVSMYQQLKEQVDQTVGRINGRWTKGGWNPIYYHYRSFSLEELLPYFIASDFALVTPLRDGLNLVAKEYCASRADLGGALVLSEMTGAAYELHEAELVNPYSLDEVADAINRVITQTIEKRHTTMQALRKQVQSNTIHHWVHNFLQASESAIAEREVTNAE